MTALTSRLWAAQCIQYWPLQGFPSTHHASTKPLPSSMAGCRVHKSRSCITWLDRSTGADHRSRAFQLTPSVALSFIQTEISPDPRAQRGARFAKAALVIMTGKKLRGYLFAVEPARLIDNSVIRQETTATTQQIRCFGQFRFEGLNSSQYLFHACQPTPALSCDTAPSTAAPEHPCHWRIRDSAQLMPTSGTR